jgi:prohibitin 2
VTRYATNQQEYTMSGSANEGARSGNDQVSARSVDGQEVFMDVTILFRVPPENVNRVHQDWNGSVYQEVFIRPTVRAVVRDVVSSYQAEEIYGLKRNDLQAQIESELSAQMAERGFELSNVLLRNISFSQEFTQAIEDKQIEEQKLQQAQTAAQRREAEAKGNANAAIETARGDAEARLVQARAEAEGLRLISDQLAANPNLLQYIYIQSLAPDIKLALIPSNSPFLFDSSTFTNLAPDFSAPSVPELLPTATPEGQ